jgi:hypothetical protein
MKGFFFLLEDVMEELKLGPNGGLVYCMEFLRENAENLSFVKPPSFFIFFISFSYYKILVTGRPNIIKYFIFNKFALSF